MYLCYSHVSKDLISYRGITFLIFRNIWATSYISFQNNWNTFCFLYCYPVTVAIDKVCSLDSLWFFWFAIALKRFSLIHAYINLTSTVFITFAHDRNIWKGNRIKLNGGIVKCTEVIKFKRIVSEAIKQLLNIIVKPLSESWCFFVVFLYFSAANIIVSQIVQNEMTSKCSWIMHYHQRWSTFLYG